MIKKEVITINTESWRSEDQTHRYVLRKQWYEGLKEEKSGKIALVITIRPTSTSAFVEDMTSMFIEKNIRQLGFTGFIVVNLFSSIHATNKATYLKGTNENTLEVISTVVKEKRSSQIIFACGSIVETNLLTEKQKKATKMLVNPNTGKLANTLSDYVRKEWSNFSRQNNRGHFQVECSSFCHKISLFIYLHLNLEDALGMVANGEDNSIDFI